MFRGGCVILTGVFHISGNNNNIRERRKNDIFRLNVTAGIRFNINKFKTGIPVLGKRSGKS